MSTIVNFPSGAGLQQEDLVNAEQVLEHAMTQDLEHVTIIGVDREGYSVFNSTIEDPGTLLLHMECLKMRLLNVSTG